MMKNIILNILPCSNPNFNLYILCTQHLSQPIGGRIGAPALQTLTAQMDPVMGINRRLLLGHPMVMQKKFKVNLCSPKIHWTS